MVDNYHHESLHPTNLFVILFMCILWVPVKVLHQRTLGLGQRYVKFNSENGHKKLIEIAGWMP